MYILWYTNRKTDSRFSWCKMVKAGEKEIEYNKCAFSREAQDLKSPGAVIELTVPTFQPETQ